MPSSPASAPSTRSTIKQAPTRANYDPATLYAILDAALVGTVAVCIDQQPFAMPMAIARIDDHLYLHGSRTSRLIKHVAAGHELCLSVMHLDGLVVARSTMHCSVNYRSAVIHARGQLIEDDRKADLLYQIAYRIIRGSAGDFREHLPQELKATSLIAIPLQEAACKIRTGGPKDDSEDLTLPYWAGVIPVTQVYGEPIPSPDLAPGIAIPAYAYQQERT